MPDASRVHCPRQALRTVPRVRVGEEQDPPTRKRLVEMSLEPTGYGPERLGAIMKDDYERWGPAIRASGFKPEQ